MTADPVDAKILHRHFVAIATSAYHDPRLPTLPEVHDELQTLAEWFCDAGLGKPYFIWRYPHLADNPTTQQIRDALQNPPPARKWQESDAAVVFITGHGKTDSHGHWLILKDTSADAPLSTRLRTAEITGCLRAGPGPL
jgi:hypothetical protein